MAQLRNPFRPTAGATPPLLVGRERQLEDSAESIELDWVIPHTFRKTVVTRLDEAGVSARMVADQLGHSRVSMTQDTYFGRGTASPLLAAAVDLHEPEAPR